MSDQTDRILKQVRDFLYECDDRLHAKYDWALLELNAEPGKKTIGACDVSIKRVISTSGSNAKCWSCRGDREPTT